MKTLLRILIPMMVLSSCGPLSLYYREGGKRFADANRDHPVSGCGAQGRTGGQSSPSKPANLLARSHILRWEWAVLSLRGVVAAGTGLHG